MSEVRKELKVSAIENGTVIDHIPAENVFQVMKILKLDKINKPVLFGTNLESKKFGKKGIIKVRKSKAGIRLMNDVNKDWRMYCF